MTSTDADAPPLDRLARVVADLGTVVGAERLTGGMFATTYRVTLAGGRRVVVKTAPVDDDRLLTYEHDLVRTEGLVYALAADRPGLLMPRLLAADHSRTAFPGDVVVAAHLDGVPWTEAGLGSPADDPRAARAERDLGALMARLHEVTGERFGYVGAVHVRGGEADPPGTRLHGATWPAAFGRMLGALLADAARWGVDVPASEVRDALVRHHEALAAVERPRLVHGDLWPGNLFVDPEDGALVGVVDAERALWADPLVELVGADQVGRGPAPAGLLAGYAAQAGAPLDVTSDAARARLLLYRLHMSLVLCVEAVPRRYDAAGEPEAFGYLGLAARNVRWALDELAALPA